MFLSVTPAYHTVIQFPIWLRHGCTRFILALTALTLGVNICLAQPADHVLWRTDDGTGSETAGIELGGGRVTFSSPAVADIDGNPQNGLETAVGGADGILYVLRSDGSLLWSAALPNAGCSKASATNKLMSSPAVGALFGDGIPYVVVGYGGLGSGECGGGVVAYRGPDGKRRWHRNLKRYAKKQKFGASLSSVFSSPALADTNGNGKLEIGFGSYDRNVYLLNARGKVLWYYQAADTVWSSPSFVNIDDSPALEMIIGTDISGNSALVPPTKDGGYVYALRTKVKRKKGQRRRNRRFGFRDSSLVIWQTAVNQTVFSTPVIADVLPANAGDEVVIGSGTFFGSGANKPGQWVKIFDLRTGKLLQTLKATACLSSTPAVGDIDNDGALEIVATVNGQESMGGDGESRILAWDPDSEDPIWEVVPRHAGGTDSLGAQFQSPILADLDGNGSLEVLAANARGVGVYEGSTGTPLHCYDQGCPNDNPRFGTRNILQNTPAVADINLDGQLDLIAVGANSGSGAKAYSWTGFAEVIQSTPGNLAPGSLPWPMFRGNPQHTGVVSNASQ